MCLQLQYFGYYCNKHGIITVSYKSQTVQKSKSKTYVQGIKQTHHGFGKMS